MTTKTPPTQSRDNSASMREIAYDHLRQLLILSQLVRGQRMREPEWAKRLGVNRAALREAFARLEAEGLLKLGAKTGYFVPEFGERDIAEIVKVRLIIEKAAVEEICGRTGSIVEILQPMRDALAAYEMMVRDRFVLGTIEADRRFHESLVQASGVGMLAQLYRRAPLPMITQQIAGREEWDRSVRETIREHGELLAALESRSVVKAKAILEQHLGRASIALMCS